MAYSFNGTNQYLSATASPLGTGQLGDHTIAFWVNGNPASSATVLSISRSTETSANNNPSILVQRGSGTSVLRYFLRANSSAGGVGWLDISGGTAFNAGWRHCCVQLSGTTGRVYVSGVEVATATVESVPTQTGMNRFGVGAFVRGNVLTYAAVTVAEIGVWSAALTAGEVLALARGVRPSLVRPQSLALSAPLVRDIRDESRGLTISNNNAATVAEHPRTYA